MRNEATHRRRYLAVAQSLLNAIARGDYASGDRLPSHAEVAVEAGVSRATAREALLALELVGAVEVRHGDGTFVRGLAGDTEQVITPLTSLPRELIESRLHIEPTVAGLAALRIDQHDIETLVADLAVAREIMDDDAKAPQFIALGLRFHAHIASCGGNQLLAEIVSQLVNVESHPLWALVNQQVMSAAEARRLQVEEHQRVLDAIVAGDSAAAISEMSDHLGELIRTVFPHGPKPRTRTEVESSTTDEH
ncbi:FadR/GntR family transcriptional regulator [Microbacterium sp. NPDC087589]|uniref:FadR/GntR family transcriptional regulator n=1 Tax=Microbacterium sp. NPDC087589 TaxID=3364191 RepID=UPI0037F10F08